MDGEILVDLHMRLAGAFEQWLANPEAAIASYNAALEIDGGNAQALERLEALFLNARRWEDLFKTYERMAGIAAVRERGQVSSAEASELERIAKARDDDPIVRAAAIAVLATFGRRVPLEDDPPPAVQARVLTE